MISYLSLSMAANARRAMGEPVEDDVAAYELEPAAPTSSVGIGPAVERATAIAWAHLRPSSHWFRNAARAALALSASVALGQALHADRAFWIVLGTLAVLRSSAAETGATALRAVGGTLVGFVLATVVIAALGDDQAVLWVLYPVSIFAAGYLPTVVNFVSGQAAFTVLVVILLNLIDPVGWSLGLVRVERVALGAAVSVVAALVLWPRGITRALANAVGAEYRAVIAYAREMLHEVLGAPEAADPSRLRRTALSARMLAEGEFSDVMNARGSRSVPVDIWAHLISAPLALLLGGDWLTRAADRQERPPDPDVCPTVARAVDALTRSADAGLDLLAAGVADLGAADPSPPSAPSPSDPWSALAEARARLLEALGDGEATRSLTVRQTMGVLWCFEWSGYIAGLGQRLTPVLAEVRAGSARSWWR